jgi:hypothetical protein
MKVFCTSFLFFLSILTFSQAIDVRPSSDSLYREDQFYASISYTLLQNKPVNYNQYSFSAGLSVGFLRDMPISKNRHWSIASGFGYAYNDIKHNLIVKNVASGSNSHTYDVNGDYDKNKLYLHFLEVPLEIRWRNSTPDSHKFWRIYSGFKASYAFATKSVFESASTGSSIVKNNTDINKLQYGPYLSFGYNTFNFYAYYALNPLFKDVKTIREENLNLNIFSVGFQFYIL